MSASDAIIDAIDATQQCGFATARGSNKGGDLMRGNPYRDIKQNLLGAVTKREIFNLDRSLHGRLLGKLPLQARTQFRSKEHRTE